MEPHTVLHCNQPLPRFPVFELHIYHIDRRMSRFTLVVLFITALSLPYVSCFSLQPAANQRASSTRRLLPLFMGRAAAVRAATKTKTDAKKAKINAVFGKRIIMAVKQVSATMLKSRALDLAIRGMSCRTSSITDAVAFFVESTGRFRRSQCQSYVGRCNQGGKVKLGPRRCK